jgi:hypothetical protein
LKPRAERKFNPVLMPFRESQRNTPFTDISRPSNRSNRTLKVNPHPEYPPEEGRYVSGNDACPAVVAIILNCGADKIPPG